MVKIHGFSTKTFAIQLQDGVSSYCLGDYQTSKVGHDAKVVAITTRFDTVGQGKILAIDGNKLLEEDEIASCYLNVIAAGADRSNILYKQNLYPLTDTSFDRFITPTQVNWNESYLTTSENDLSGYSIEITIHFITSCQTPVLSNITFDNNLGYITTNKRTIHTNTQVNIAKFYLENGKNPLNRTDKIVGIRCNSFDHQTMDGVSAVSLFNMLGASFLTLMVGSRVLLDQMPLTELKPFLTGIKYYPIEPTRADEFDWSKCVIELADKSISETGKAFSLTLYYIPDD